MASWSTPPRLHVAALIKGFAKGAFPANNVDCATVLGYAFEQTAIGLSVIGDPHTVGAVLAQIEIERIGAGIPDGLQIFAGLVVSGLLCRETARVSGEDPRSVLRRFQHELDSTGEVFG